VFTKPATHCFSCSIGSPNDLVPRLCIYTLCENYRNIMVSNTSWSTYLSLSMQANRLGVACNPFGMCNKMIEALGFLRGDRAMGYFPFLCVGTLDVPASGSPSLPDSGFPMISSSYNSSCCMEPTIGFGLGSSDSVLSLSPPFFLWSPSTLEGCCGFPMVNGSWPCSLSCKLISLSNIIGAFPYSSNSVALTGSTCGEGITSTSMIPSVCVNSCSTSTVTYAYCMFSMLFGLVC
jgi:hypothetical protein